MAELKSKTLFSGNISVEYGQIYIDTPDAERDEDDYLDPDEAFENQLNGLCGAAQKGKLFFVTGIRNGTASVDIQLFSARPDCDLHYDEIVEVAFQGGPRQVALCEWGCEESYLLELPPASYRVRYSIINMHKEYDDHEGDWGLPVPGQKHLIEFWSAEKFKDNIVKVTSDNAKYWHSEWGGG